MTLVQCEECGHEVSDKAFACPQCGKPRRSLGYQYKSKTTLFGLPLIHIAMGGGGPGGYRRGVAKGIIAVGDIAFGVFAFGGLAMGGVAFGGAAFGLVALGGLAVGLGLAVGGAAVGLVAIGGGAVGYYAFGGGAFGAHTISGMGSDAQAVEFFKRFLGDWVENVSRGRH